MKIVLITLTLLLLAGSSHDNNFVKDSSFEMSTDNSTNKYWDSFLEYSSKIFCKNNDTSICELTSYDWAIARTGKWFAIFEGYGLMDSFQQMWQFLDFYTCDRSVEFNFYLKIVSTGDDNSIFTVKFVNYHSDHKYELFVGYPQLAEKYSNYTLVSKKIWLDGCSPGYLVFEHKGYQNPHFNLTHYIIDDISVM